MAEQSTSKAAAKFTAIVRCAVREAEHPAATIWRAICNDASLLVVFIGDERQRLLREHIGREERRIVTRVQADRRSQRQPDPVEATIADEASERHHKAAEARARASEHTFEKAFTTLARRATAVVDELRASWIDSMLGQFHIYGEPIGDSSVHAAKGWLAHNQRDGRFVELLIAGLPDDGRPISFYRNGQEADALWRQAREDQKTTQAAVA